MKVVKLSALALVVLAVWGYIAVEIAMAVWA